MLLASGIETGGTVPDWGPTCLKPLSENLSRIDLRGNNSRVDVETQASSADSNYQPCPLLCFVHLRTGNPEYYKNISLNARDFFASYKSFCLILQSRILAVLVSREARGFSPASAAQKGAATFKLRQHQKILAIYAPLINIKGEDSADPSI